MDNGSRFLQPYSLLVVPATAGSYYLPYSATSTAATGVAVPAAVTVSGGTWTESSKTLTKTGAFTNYTLVAGDVIAVTGGTGATAGSYAVATRVSNDAITLSTSIGSGADGQTNIAANISIISQLSNPARAALTAAVSTGGILMLDVQMNSVGAAAGDKIEVCKSDGTVLNGLSFVAKATAPSPCWSGRPRGVFVSIASDCIIFKTTGNTGWLVTLLPFPK